MKRRWRLLLLCVALLAALILVPIGFIEGTCRAPVPGMASLASARPLLPPADRRPLANTFLTYPEWHIVYEAEAFARHLTAGAPPSSFAFGTQIAQFWASYCTLNRVTRDDPDAAAAKVTIYTIGISYTLELAVKAAYERTIGRFFEWASGWTSSDDRYAAEVQRRYGAFLHETPWYRFPFTQALSGLWRTREPVQHARHVERRFALSAEYGVKALYAKAIDAVTGATVGRDELTLHAVVRGTPGVLGGIDPRIRPVGGLPGGLTMVELPRYQQFNDLLAVLARHHVDLVEIAGNRTIFVTVLLPPNRPSPPGTILAMPVDEHGGRRVGVVVPVPKLLAMLRQVSAGGGRVEHVYDY